MKITGIISSGTLIALIGTVMHPAATPKEDASHDYSYDYSFDDASHYSDYKNDYIAREIFNNFSDEDRTKFNVRGWTPGHYAAKCGNLNMAKYIIQNDSATLAQKDTEGDTPLHLAAQSGHVDIVEYIIQIDPATITQKNNEDETPLHSAAYYGHLNIVKYIIKIDSTSVTQKKNTGWTPLHLAAFDGHLNIVKYIIKKNPTTLTQKINTGETPLHIAALRGHLAIVEHIIQIDPTTLNQKDIAGEAPLHLAACNGCLNIVKYIIKKDPTAFAQKDNDGSTALLLAARNGHLDMVKYITKKVPSSVTQKNIGWTPLHVAAYYGHLDIVKYIVKKHPTTITEKTNDGDAPLHLAARHGHLDIAQQIIAIDPNGLYLKNFDGRMPVHHAAKGNHFAIILHMATVNRSIPRQKNNETEQITIALEGRNALRNQPRRKIKKVAVPSGQDAADCPICCTDKVEIKLGCGHEICRDCLVGEQGMIRIHGLGGSLEQLRCPHAECGSPFAYDIADQKIVFKKNRPLRDQYNDIILRISIKDNPLLRPCPNPGCGNMIELNPHEVNAYGEVITIREIQCLGLQCKLQNFRYCNGCLQKAHPRLTCQQALSESKSSLVDTKNQKYCPTCNVLIEKGDGCQYIQCKSECPEFCWFCKELHMHKSHFCKDNQGAAAKKSIWVNKMLFGVNTHDEARARGYSLNDRGE